MGRYGNIEGIVTLTNDSIAVQNIRNSKEDTTKNNVDKQKK